MAVFRAGDDDAFRVIHDRYRAPLLTYARHVLGASSAEAEDVLQDVFVRAYRGLRAHDRGLSLSPWLYRVARNACIDELRRRVPVPYEELPQTDRAPDADPVLTQSIQRDRVRQLMLDLQQLPEQQRSALILCELSGMSYADVAATLETSVSAVKSLLVRARLGLAQSLEARETACSEIRDELAGAHARGERPNALVRRHLHDCQGCGGYGLAMRDRQRELAALAPTVGPVAVLAKLFGFGGAAAAGGTGGTTAATGGLAVSAGVIGANAAHLLTVLAATTIVAAGALGIKEATATHTPARPSTTAQPSYVPPAPQTATAAATRLSRPGAATAAAAIHRVTAVGSGSATSHGQSAPSSAGGAAGTGTSSATSATPAPSATATKTSSSSSCPVGQQSCSGGATSASTSYSGTSATSSQLPLGGSGGSSTSTGVPHLSATPIGGDTGSSSDTTPPPSNTSSNSSSQPLGSSSSPPLGS